MNTYMYTLAFTQWAVSEHNKLLYYNQKIKYKLKLMQKCRHYSDACLKMTYYIYKFLKLTLNVTKLIERLFEPNEKE